MKIDPHALIRAKRNPENFKKLRESLHKSGYTDREIVCAMAGCPDLVDALGREPPKPRIPRGKQRAKASPARNKVSGYEQQNRQKDRR